MNAPIEPEPAVEFSVHAFIPALCFDNPRLSHLFVMSRLNHRFRAKVRKSDNGVRWLITRVGGKRFGWPLRAVQDLIDRDSLRVYIDGEEQDETKRL